MRCLLGGRGGRKHFTELRNFMRQLKFYDVISILNIILGSGQRSIIWVEEIEKESRDIRREKQRRRQNGKKREKSV